jgi:hypothetical protein
VPPPVNCAVSNWSSWGSCTASCGGGTQTRTRTIVTQPTLGGLTCPALSEQQSCNTEACPTYYALCIPSQYGVGRLYCKPYDYGGSSPGCTEGYSGPFFSLEQCFTREQEYIVEQNNNVPLSAQIWRTVSSSGGERTITGDQMQDTMSSFSVAQSYQNSGVGTPGDVSNYVGCGTCGVGSTIRFSVTFPNGTKYDYVTTRIQ